ncbi:hypothetical protein SAMN04487950_3999 [Halogranum rubrum]|uniref:DUF8106 domain-containing protein n=1 Tax=Halogranum rubrum TaxID=553466 RepID=A0A1I4I657_9EURY|nr:hypothetical protein [Halogranum rubrum]SFL49879.1 hypothetical protein SAMN04487950_3999 [Halogranum rubrum]
MTHYGSQSPQTTLAPDRKGVLFCPSCEHTSPFDGDWRVRETCGGLTYRCPVCHELVQRRPVFDSTPRPTPATAQATPFGPSPKAVQNWARVWSSWTTAWVQFVRQSQR